MRGSGKVKKIIIIL